MGLFSKPKVYDLSPMSEEQIGFLILFFRNGWAKEARRRLNRQTLFDSRMDKEIVKSLQKKYLLKDEMDVVLELLNADLRFHPDDKDEQRIISDLKRCIK